MLNSCKCCFGMSGPISSRQCAPLELHLCNKWSFKSWMYVALGSHSGVTSSLKDHSNVLYIIFWIKGISAKQYQSKAPNDIADNMSYSCKCIKIKILLQKQIKSIVLGLARLHLYLSSSFVPGPYFCSMAAKEKSTITVL